MAVPAYEGGLAKAKRCLYPKLRLGSTTIVAQATSAKVVSAMTPSSSWPQRSGSSISAGRTWGFRIWTA
eukprot:1158511-Pelagomonas_calceolata.AAC.2